MPLAHQVVRRFLADAIADPKETLARFKSRVDDFCKHEAVAKAQLPALKRFVEMIASGTSNVREPGESQDLAKFVNSENSTRRDIKWELKGGHWFKFARPSGRHLFWAILQQYALPPQLQKSIEAANKFWAKERTVVRVKAMRDTYDEDIELLTLYLKTCAELQKQLANAEAAIIKGKLHSDPEVAAQTKFHAGSFEVVNVGGFDADTMRKAVDVVTKAEKAMTSAGLGRVCYGDVLISKHIQNKKSVAAFYVVSSDEMFVRADLPDDSDTVQHVCHELGHRLEHKFLANKRGSIALLYAKLSNEDEDRESIPVEAYPRPGEVYTTQGEWAKKDPGKTVRVKAFDLRRKTVQYMLVDADGKVEPGAYYETGIEAWWRMFRGEPLKVEEKTGVLGRFVTHYAKVGGPSENFAEMVAHYVLGQLPRGQIKPLEEILFG